jgi:hypothetical protein
MVRGKNSAPPIQHLVKELHKKAVHKQELRGCGDLFIWFGGPLEKSSKAQLSVNLSFPQ